MRCKACVKTKKSEKLENFMYFAGEEQSALVLETLQFEM